MEIRFFLYLKKYEIPGDEYDIVYQKWDMTQFFNDEVDVASAMSYNELLAVYKKYGKDNLNVFYLRDLGVGFPGQNIFTTKSYYRANPDICRKFIKASLKGWEYAIANPEDAADIVMKYDKEHLLDREHQIAQLKEIIKLIDKEVYPLRIHNIESYKFIKNVYQKYNIIGDIDIKDYFTDEFVIN